MSERLALMDAFISKAGWGDAERVPVKGDASTRSYVRLVRKGQQAVLMNAPHGAEPAGEPDGASVEDRRQIGYNALARLAGPNLEAFLTIAEQLSIRGFSAPHIYAADLDLGFALLEDFGDVDFARTLGADPRMNVQLYEAAVDTLAAIYRSSFPTRPSYDGTDWAIRDYDDAALLAETDLFLDYFAPDAGHEINAAQRDEFYGLWCEAFKAMDAHAPGLALRDFHAENLFWLPGRDGEAKVGLIDFQDALFVHPAYDLTSLLEDIRRDVDPALFEPLKSRFCDKVGITRDDTFDAAYSVLSAQRATKLLGFPVRADVDFGKPQYRALLPRVKRHLANDLAHPVCADLRAWFQTYVPEVFS